MNEIADALAAARVAADKVTVAHAVLMATIKTAAANLREVGDRLHEAEIEARAAGLKTNVPENTGEYVGEHVEVLAFDLKVKLMIDLSPAPPPERPLTSEEIRELNQIGRSLGVLPS